MKVQEFIRTRGVTPCPAMGTPELAQMNAEREKARAEAATYKWGTSLRRRRSARKPGAA